MKAITGIQPTNTLHVGNIFGALVPAVKLQDEYDLSMMIVDYHAITVPFEPTYLKENILFAAATYLAAGIDPTKTTLFQQSAVPAHTELAWILQSVARMGEMERMTQFKDKSQKGGVEKASVGLFTYPVLMAADILLHDAAVVPIGEDQKQHLELTRNLAERFNNKYGDIFVIPEPRITQQAARIKSLTEPEKKMSKSAPSAKSYISIMDEEDIVAKKIRSAVTDSESGITLSDERPGLKNLLTLFSLVSDKSPENLAAIYTEKGMKSLKEDLSEHMISYLQPIQAKIKLLLDDRNELITILNEGQQRASRQAEQKLQQVKEAIGITF